MATSISLVPLDPNLHTDALQGVYTATPGYWAMYNLPGCPPDQAAKDLEAARTIPGRFLMGIVQRIDPTRAEAGAEMIGVIDFRLHWPAEQVVYIGMLMVAETRQRHGTGTQAWSLLKPWLARSAHMHTARLGAEQFNIGGLKFWQYQGFTLTGESERLRVGDKFVRLLYLEQSLAV